MPRKQKYLLAVMTLLLSFVFQFASVNLPAYADSNKIVTSNLIDNFAGTTCGASPNNVVHTTVDFGCQGKGPAILDLTFGVIQFLSDGVGLVVVASLVYAGIQYITSSGDPQATAAAVKRIRSSVTALILFIFAYAILNYVIPGQVLQ